MDATPRDDFLDLLALVRDIFETRDPRRALSHILDTVNKHASAERSYIVTRGPQGKYDIRAGRRDGSDLPLALADTSQTLVETAITLKGSFFAEKALSHVNLKERASVRITKIQSAFVVPLRLEDRAFGALVVENRTKSEAFDERQRQGVEYLAALVTRTIHEIETRATDADEPPLTASRIDDEALRGLVGDSKKMLELKKQLPKLGAAREPVLITGESGTGKEVVARALHKLSSRADHPFEAVNAAAIPATMAESELFGHTKGAFTGAVSERHGLFRQAHKGTLFIDEVGELSLDLQAKLLRAIQEGRIRRVGGEREEKVDVRLLAATNVDLKKAIRDGKFREDLYYRLHVLHVHLPPLRERAGDVAQLIDHILKKIANELGARNPKGLAPAARAELLRHDWPGNVRELDGVLRAAHVLSGKTIKVEDLKLDGPRPNQPTEPGTLAAAEKAAVLKAIESTDTLPQAAKVLGINKVTLYRKVREYGLNDLIAKREASD